MSPLYVNPSALFVWWCLPIEARSSQFISSASNKHIVFQNNISIIFHKLLNLPTYLFNFIRFILLLILSKMVKKLSKCGTAHDKCCHMLRPHNSIFSLPIWYLCIIPYLWNRKYICTVLARFKISLGKSNIEAKSVNRSSTTATKNKY